MDVKISEIIDLPQLQQLMESLYQATGINHALLDLEGTVLTAAGWKKICTGFHRLNPRSLLRCQESDRYIFRHLSAGPYVGYKCLNGLYDYCTPVVIGGKHLASIFTGQIFHQPPDLDYFRSQAREFGFAEEAYLAAVAEVKIFPEERMPAVMAFLASLAGMVGNMGLLRLNQLKAAQELEEKVAERTAALQNSLDEITALRGILPICSFCKKVRNDKGYYEQIEEYFHKSAGVDFSHTVCPTCLKKNYPEDFEALEQMAREGKS